MAAFGKNLSEGEINYYINGNLTYTVLVNGHMGYLVRNNSENEKCIKRAYQVALGRLPTAQEIGFGVASGRLIYLFWVGWLQDHAHGKNSINIKSARVLKGIMVMDKVTLEARNASGLTSSGSSNMGAASGGN